MTNEPMPNEPKLPSLTDRVFTSMEYAGFRAMQVCVLPDVTDAEILEHCNKTNPQLVSGGWHSVITSKEDAIKNGMPEEAASGECEDCAGRIHKIVLCM